MSELKAGDTVVIKSGGPQMTIERMPSGVAIFADCIWKDESGNLQKTPVAIHALRKY